MKRKIIVPLILASVSATSLGIHSQFTVKADYDYGTDVILNGDLIKVSGFVGEANIGEEIKLPNAVTESSDSSIAAATPEVTVIDPRGRKVTLRSVDGKMAFKPAYRGYYTVRYTAIKNGHIKTASEELRILVKGSEYTIKLPDNSENVIPATIKTGQTIDIPLPTVTKDLKDLTSLDDIISDDENVGLKVFVLNKDDSSSATPVSFNKTSKTFKYEVENSGVYEIIYRFYQGGTVQDYKTDTFVAKSDYKYQDINLSFKYIPTKPTTGVLGNKLNLPNVSVFDKNNSNASIDAHVSIKVEHMSTKTKYEVSDYSFIPMNKGDYKVTYQVSIPLFGLESDENSFIIEDVKDNQRPNFFVSNSYEMNDDKTQVKRVYRDINKNNKFDEGDDIELFNIDNVGTLTKEEVENEIANAMGNTTYNIPSIVVLDEVDGGLLSKTIKVPAIYATDNFTEYKNLSLKRYVRTENGLQTELRREVVGEPGKTESYPANEWAECTFTTAGNYTIKYEALDEIGNAYTISYDVKVLASDATLKKNDNFIKPTITFPAITSYAKKTATLSIPAPTATDTYDTRVEVRLFHSFDSETFSNTNEITKGADGKYKLNLGEIGIDDEKKVYIHAIAYNDYALKPNEQIDYSQYTREVNIINTEDSSAPIFTNLGDFMEGLKTQNDLPSVIDEFGMVTYTDEKGQTVERAAFLQKDEVKLPKVIITDEDTNLNISLKVVDPYGNPVSVRNASDSKTVDATNNTYTIEDGYFFADYSGVYTITYTAQDAGGNMVSKSFGIRVQDTEKPKIILSSYDAFTSAVEVGKFIEVPNATLYDREKLLTDITTNIPYESRDLTNKKPGVYWDFVKRPDADRTGTIGFTPKVAGNYVIKYFGWDAEGNLTESKTYTISAADTIKPTIELEKGVDLTYSTLNEGGTIVQAPGVIQLYDGYRNADRNYTEDDYDQTSPDKIEFVVKVYDKNNNLIDDVKEVEVQTGVDGYGDDDLFVVRYQFKALEHGKYRVAYIASDKEGNSTEKSVEIKVGDIIAPEIEWIDSEKDLITTAKINSYFEFNQDFIKLDGIKTSEAIKIPDEETEGEYKITINMYDPTSSLVANDFADKKDGTYRWKFEKSGTYELRITATDKAGNAEPKTYSIIVNEEETETKTVKPVVKTILIVAASLILVGVVAYFVITSRKKDVKKPKRKKKN